MKNNNYSEKLKDPRWQKMRLKIFDRDNWECVACGDHESTLCVHHKYYDANAEPWDYPEDSLVTLCEACHEIRHLGSKPLEMYVYEKLNEKFNDAEIYKISKLLSESRSEHKTLMKVIKAVTDILENYTGIELRGLED